MIRHKKTIIQILQILLIVFILENVSIPISSQITTDSNILVVSNQNKDGPWEGSWDHPFYCIHDAINHSSGGEQIYIQQGTYTEHLIIDKPLTLIGINNPVIHGRYQKSIIKIQSNDITIKNIIVCYSGGNNDDAAIFIENTSHITITDSTFHHTRHAILLSNCNNISIHHNIFSNNGNGIICDYSTTITIENNSFSHNAIGIASEHTHDVSMKQCTFIGNGLSALFSNTHEGNISYCNLSDNSVNKGGFFFESSSNWSIYSCLFFHNGDGISLSSSQNITISYSDFIAQTHFALSLRASNTDITISDCIIAKNKRIGIYIEQNNSCTITQCNIYQNHLSDISGDHFICTATNNWWDSIRGPFQQKNDIKPFLFSIQSFPWALNTYSTIGVKSFLIPHCKDITFAPDYQITFQETDTDQDIIPDWWEQKWGYSPYQWQDHEQLDPDEDGLSNIQECYMDTYGANPYEKDVFVEIDWMTSDPPGLNKPSSELIQQIIDEFKEHNTNLHIDCGALGGGSEIPDNCMKPSSYRELHDIYWTYFLNNTIDNPRKGIFHYGLITNFCADLNFPFIGWDQFDSFAISAEWLETTIPHTNRETIIAGAIMHQLGHTLGLIADVYDGIDNIKTIQLFSKQWAQYLPYYSCMNYYYKYKILSYSDGIYGPNDFNDWDHINYDYFQQSNFSAIPYYKK